MQSAPHKMTRVSGFVVTTPIATPGVVNSTATLPIAAGTPVIFNGGTLPTGITAGTVYYVSTAGLTATTFQITATQAQALAGTNSIAFTGTSSGTQYASFETLIGAIDSTGVDHPTRLISIFPEATTLGTVAIRDVSTVGTGATPRHTQALGMTGIGMQFGGGDSGVLFYNGVSIHLSNGADAVNVVWNTQF